MKAMVLNQLQTPLVLQEVELPKPKPTEVLLEVLSCGICRTDLHVIDGELDNIPLPLIPGHQIIGRIASCGAKVISYEIGQIVGLPWLGSSCGVCQYCLNRQENLCDNARYTGYQQNGGFAEFCVADFRYIFSIPQGYSPTQAAPLLCAGLIGYRAYRKVGDAIRLGVYGFGAAAHILTQVACFENKKIYAFTKTHDIKGQHFAKSLGAVWAGDSSQNPPTKLDGAILFAPVGELVPKALRDIKKGAKVICAGIHMTDIPSFPYHILWGERVLESVANLTREDGELFLALAPRIPIHTVVNEYALTEVNEALDDLRHGRFNGAAVIKIAN
jgi:alcohol dehydrogenase, propanol-preferring